MASVVRHALVARPPALSTFRWPLSQEADVTDEIEKRWSQLMSRIDEPDPGLVGDLEGIQGDLQEELFGGRPELGRTYDPEPESLSVLLDALEALALLEPGDASYPWDRAVILSVVGRPLDAAHAYVEAADRFGRSPALTGDEADWAAESREKAALCFQAAGRPASAAAIKALALG
jgi:hypothetical protein